MEDDLVLGLGGRADREPGQQRAEQQPESDEERSGGTVTAVPTPSTEPPAVPFPGRRPFPSPTPSTASTGRTPITGWAGTTPRCSTTSSPSGLSTTRRLLIWTPFGSALKAEMLSRLPTDDESARWSRRRFTYWTRHPVNSDYAELRRLNHDSDAGSTTESESSSLIFDIAAEDRGTGYLDLGVTLGQSGRGPARLQRRHRRATRSSSCASATCAPARTCPTVCRAATTAVRGAPTRSGSSTPCTTRRTGPSRSGATGSAPTRPTTSGRARGAGRALRARPPRHPQRRPGRDLEREPVDR